MIVYVRENGNKEEALRLAQKMNLSLVEESAENAREWMEKEGREGRKKNRSRIDKRERDQEEELILYFDENGFSLRANGLCMQGDFTQMLSRIRPGSLQKEFLYKASKLKKLGEHPVAVDATAGMGEDSLILAAAGYDVYLYELNPVIAALLKDTVERSRDIPELSDAVSRMHVMEGDSISAMREIESRIGLFPDLILLDPMFPARKKSGLIKKKFQLLQRLEQPCSEEESLMEAAIMAKPRRLLVKRPLKGPYLADRKPDYSLSGKAIRYDCFNVRIDNMQEG